MLLCIIPVLVQICEAILLLSNLSVMYYFALFTDFIKQLIITFLYNYYSMKCAIMKVRNYLQQYVIVISALDATNAAVVIVSYNHLKSNEHKVYPTTAVISSNLPETIRSTQIAVNQLVTGFCLIQHLTFKYTIVLLFYQLKVMYQLKINTIR